MIRFSLDSGSEGKVLMSVTALTVLVLFLSCSFSETRGEKVTRHLETTGTGSKNVVILPFENESGEKDLEKLVRESFYKHLSAKNYRDVELNEVDRALEILSHDSKTTWKDLGPSDLKRMFGADYAIYGEVLDYDEVFLAIYSQISLTVRVRIVRCQDGKEVWQQRTTERSHDGGIPLGLLGVIPAAVRSGIHLRDERTMDIIERLNRKLVDEIPEPPKADALPFFVEIQVASFQDRTRAEKTKKNIETKGFSPRIETAILGDKQWHRVLLGPYYKVGEAETVKEQISEDTKFQPIYIRHYPKERD